MVKTDLCPCGSDKEYTDCCGQYITGNDAAPTAEALMRSRYTAYTLQDEAYLYKTWHDSTKPETLELSQEQLIKWTGLAVKRQEQGDEHDKEGIVEFIARYKLNGKAEKIHETSRFIKQDGQWFYVEGKIS